jgi:hypothetical protein
MKNPAGCCSRDRGENAAAADKTRAVRRDVRVGAQVVLIWENGLVQTGIGQGTG